MVPAEASHSPFSLTTTVDGRNPAPVDRLVVYTISISYIPGGAGFPSTV